MKKQLSNVTIATRPADQGEPVDRLMLKTVNELALKHGDLLFLNYASVGNQQNLESSQSSEAGPELPTTATAAQVFQSVKQSALDDQLDKDPGMITRPRDPKMCCHGDKGMCDYCMPLEPYDASYQEEHKIKHLSFHAYLKKLNSENNKSGGSSSYMAPLEEPFYGVAKKCPGGHPPWPAGICSKCQPSAITLQQQSFRMVDHVEFADFGIVNTFIDAWRKTGLQRIGYLYGTYQRYDAVPLGVRAVVEAIYEPSQSDELDGVTLTLPNDEEEKHVDELAKAAGLQKLGVVFTDLLDAGKGDGSVVCKRHVDSYFLSSLEIAFAAKLQKENRNPCRWSTDGQFSSKFVTCVISGNLEGQIDIASYQSSMSAEAMMDADLIEPSVNPSVMRIKEPTSTRYVPDIFYKKINEYKLTVQENAKPAFPVEYLLVTLTHGFPEKPAPLFTPGESFPIENRGHTGVSQDFHAIKKQLGNGTRLEAKDIADFHFLVHVTSLGILSGEESRLLVQAAVSKNEEDLYLLSQSPGWQSLLTIASTQ